MPDDFPNEQDDPADEYTAGGSGSLPGGQDNGADPEPGAAPPAAEGPDEEAPTPPDAGVLPDAGDAGTSVDAGEAGGEAVAP